MKVDYTQCMDFKNEIFRNEQKWRNIIELAEEVGEMLAEISYSSWCGRLVFDTSVFYPKFDEICEKYKNNHHYCFVTQFIELFMYYFAAGISVGENSEQFNDGKQG